MVAISNIDASGRAFPGWLITSIIIGIVIFFGSVAALWVCVGGKGCCRFTSGRATPPPVLRYTYGGNGASPTAQLIERSSSMRKDNRQDSQATLVNPPPPYAPSLSTHSRSPTAQIVGFTSRVEDRRVAEAPVRNVPPSLPPAYFGLGRLGGRISPSSRILA